MNKLFKKITDMLAERAQAEIEGYGASRKVKPAEQYITHGFSKASPVEQELMVVAYAEAADFETARRILHEMDHLPREREVAVPDDCQYGDNDLCSAQA